MWTDIDSVGALNNSAMKLNEILENCARSAAPCKEKRPRKAKLRTWTPVIQTAVVAIKKAFFEWKIAGSTYLEDQTVINKKKTESLLRQFCRREVSNKVLEERQVIIDSSSSDTPGFISKTHK